MAAAISKPPMIEPIEPRLLESERDFAFQVVSLMEQGVAVSDANGFLRYVNAAMSRLTGRAASDLLGKKTDDIFVPEDRAAQSEHGQRRMRGESSVYLAQLLRPDGGRVPVSISASPFMLNGKFYGSTAVLEDLTEKAHWQNELQAERDFATQILDTVGQGISVTNPGGTVDYVNPALARMFGCEAKDLIGANTEKLFVAEDLWIVAQQRLARLAGKTSSYEARLKRASGEPFWVSITSAPRWQDGQFTGTISAITDLSARRAQESALEESEARFRTLIERSPGAIVVHRDGVVLYVNPACVEMFGGSSASNYIGLNIFDFAHPADREGAIERSKHVMQSGDMMPAAQFRAVTATGQVIQVETRGFRIFYDGGPALCSTLYDVTARNEAAEASAIINRRSEIFGDLARDLSEATDQRAAAIRIVEAAQELIGWDASWLRLWDADSGSFSAILDFDTYDGQILPLPEAEQKQLFRPSPIILKVITDGPQIVLRDSPDDVGARDYVHGNGQPALSLLFAPIVRGEEFIGVLSVQSYTPKAYDKSHLDLLTALAAHSAGAIARLQSVDALKESEARFKYAIDATEDGIWDWNIVGNQVYFSPQWKRLLGYRPDEVEDDLDFFFKAIHPDDVQSIQTTLDDHLAGRTPVKMSEVRLKTKSGGYRWFADRGKVVAWAADGKPARMVGTITDITSQKDTETNLQDSERRYRALVEWSPEPSAVHRGGRLVYVNPAFLRLVQVNTVEEALKYSLLDYVHPDDRQFAMERMQAVASGAPMAPLVEMRGTRPNGTDMFVETQGTAIMFDGAPAVHVVVRDISQRRQAEAARATLEAQLRESQKMQAIGTLAGGIAHDFNNILAIILGNVELASQDAKDARELESLGEIRKAATRARDLVRQILSFSRRQPAERKRIRLQPVVAEGARLLKATLPARLALHVHLADDVPPTMADATQIEQVVLNLCTNAMQAIPLGNGNIRIQLDVVSLDRDLPGHPAAAAWTSEQRRNMVRLTVADDGPGMHEDVLARIFEPFFTTKAVDEGTGLGLSVVHGIVEGHDGAILCESELGRGSTFTVYLPPATADGGGDVQAVIETPAATEGRVGAPIAPQSGSPAVRVFYLDDDESLVFLIERLLGRRGFVLKGFTDQQAALKALADQPDQCDVLITDYNMPGMTGLEVARVARAIRPDLPVCIASGFLDERLREQAHAAGVNNLIFKATAVDDFCEAFVEVVNTLAGGQRGV